MNQAAEVMNEVEVKESRKSTFMQSVWAKMGKEEKGFTLIELLAVLVIIAIIAVIAIPLIGGIINNSKDDSDLATARQVYDASRLYITSEKAGDFQGTAPAAGGAATQTVNIAGTDSLQGKKFLEDPLYLPSNKLEITSGSVVYEAGALKSVTLTTSAGNKSFDADEILKSEKK